MRAVFRADASTEIGTGHVVRCLTLAEKLRKSDFDITFICKDLPGNMIEAIEQANFTVRDEEAFGGSGWDWLVVDHYDLDHSFESSMRSTVKKILVIDDLADRVHDCDLLLDQNLYDDMEMRYSDLVRGTCRTLIGPRYALLRTEFIEARRRVKRDNELRRILVSFGGSDPTNETLKVLRAMSELNCADLVVDVLVGRSNLYYKELEAFAHNLPGIVLRGNTNRISELMLRADLAIGAGGATSWERCCLGLPSITIAVADNQIALSQAVADHGYQIYLGVSENVTVGIVVDTVKSCMVNFSDAVAMGRNSMKLVDGKGADRIVAAMKRA